jgi:hypothetical protein
MKQLTRAQLEGRKEKAVGFTRNVLGDPDRADEIEAESLEDYAERRKVKLLNSCKRRKAIMPRTTKTKADLEAEISDLQDENQDLQDQLDAIADIVAPEMKTKKMQIQTTGMKTKRIPTRTDSSPAVWAVAQGYAERIRPRPPVPREPLPASGRSRLLFLRLHPLRGSGAPGRVRGEHRAGKPDLELPRL